MNIAIIGSGGREHALALSINASPQTKNIYCIPGNGGTANIATNVEIDILDFDALIKFSKENEVDLTIVGPEVPLVAGIVDAYEKEGLKIFGPNQSSARLEGSKNFSKAFMDKYNIKTASHFTVKSLEEGIEVLNNSKFPTVIKADGLCAGKGVTIVATLEEGIKNLEEIFVDKIFGDEGSEVVIEEFLDGFEVSQLCLVSNNKLYPLQTSQDYKRIGNNDTGPNTGGVGCLSPSPFVDETVFENIYKNIEEGLEKEDLGFYGILFIGFMIVDGETYILEFNTRFGDPETEVILPRLKSDLLEVLLDIMNDKEPNLVWTKEKALALVLTSAGYPNEFEKGKEITITDEGIVYHNGTKAVDNKLLTNGGRVLTFVSLGDSYTDLNKTILERLDKVSFEGMTYRTDIGLFNHK